MTTVQSLLIHWTANTLQGIIPSKNGKNSPELKISLTKELTETNWDFIYNENSLDAKVEKFKDHVCSLYDKHFPIKNIHVPMGKPPLIRKLKRAKYRAHRKNNPAWKALSAILKFHQQKELHKKTDNEN